MRIGWEAGIRTPDNVVQRPEAASVILGCCGLLRKITRIVGPSLVGGPFRAQFVKFSSRVSAAFTTATTSGDSRRELGK